MRDLSRYQGIFPAFYACYDKDGRVSAPAIRALAKFLLDKGVQGLYVGGSSGECIYQSVAERKETLENVMAEVGGKLTIIAHVACNNTEGSLSDAAPNTDFVIYNIPQLAGVALSVPLLQEMLKNPRVIGVKNSSMPVQDIQMWHDEGALVFNGPDEQLLSGLAAGAAGGIGGTYAAMPELYLEIFRCFQAGELAKGREVQNECCRIIYKMCSAQGNMYAVIKEILRLQGGPDVGSVRAPLLELEPGDRDAVVRAHEMIQAAIAKYC